MKKCIDKFDTVELRQALDEVCTEKPSGLSFKGDLLPFALVINAKKLCPIDHGLVG